MSPRAATSLSVESELAAAVSSVRRRAESASRLRCGAENRGSLSST